MLLQEAPADTFSYMAFGFAVILGIMGLYVLSLVNRFRNLERDKELLDELSAKTEPSIENSSDATR